MNPLAELIRFSLVGLGLVYILTMSGIMRYPRVFFLKLLVGTQLKAVPPWPATLTESFAGMFIALIYCPACFGFWTGLALQRLWPWHAYYGIDAAIALCALGSLAATQWSDGPKFTELQMLGFKTPYDGGEDGGDEDDGSAKES